MEGCRFCAHLKEKSKGDQGQRFEIRGSLSGATRTGHAWTDNPAQLPKIVDAFELWPAMSAIEVFDRHTHEFYTPAEIYAEHGKPS